MAKSAYAEAVDAIQRALRPILREHDFRVRGRTFNRGTQDGLTHVLGIQMGASDPPGTTYIPGLRENLHGWFTVNLGVYVPEVALYHGGSPAKSWVQDFHCCVRARLSRVSGETRDLWWKASAELPVVDDVRQRIELYGIPFLDRFGTRDRILAEWHERSERMGASSPPRIVLAIILAARGQREASRSLLAAQEFESRISHPRHAEYVRELATTLGVGPLDG